jgi:hypothetical protein
VTAGASSTVEESWSWFGECRAYPATWASVTVNVVMRTVRTSRETGRACAMTVADPELDGMGDAGR